MHTLARTMSSNKQVRSVARRLLKHVEVRRRLTDTPTKVTFPAWQYLGLLRSGAMNYEPEIRRLLAERLSGGGSYVDVGANLGLHALFARSLVGANGRIVAVEPDPQSMFYLLKNISPYENVLPCAIAIGDQSRLSTINLDLATARTTSLGDATWAIDKSSRRTLFCAEATIDQLLEAADIKPDVIKIDIEGHEIMALSGMRAVARVARPLIIIEVRREHLQDAEAWATQSSYLLLDALTDKKPGVNYSGNLVLRPL